VRTLIQTTDRSLVESLRVALEEAGIEAQIFDHTATSLPFIPVTVVILHDDDFQAATDVLRALA
jgi:putative signal transducing protein